MSIPIVFENSNVVIVDKPAGMLAVPGRFMDDPRPVLGRQLESQLGSRLWPVHRLDFEVSGVMAFAKTAESHKVLNAAFENRIVQKTYQAFTELIGDEKFGEKQIWMSAILRGKKRSFESPHGQPSETWAMALRKVDAVTIKMTAVEWQLEPLTGRPHQLRFEMFKHHRPIIGDQLYGSLLRIPNGIALRAVRIVWPQKISGALAMPEFSEVSRFSL